MNSKQQKIWDLIFSDPLSSKVHWKDVESLLYNLGARVENGKGSQVRVRLGRAFASFHQPHPQKELVKKAVKKLRDFLKEARKNDEI